MRRRSDPGARLKGRPRPRARGLDLVGLGLTAVGLPLAALGLVMIAAPGVFFDVVAPFGVRNDHYAVDAGTFQLALGAGALMAVRIRGWRIPVLSILTLQFALHTLNHLKDIGAAEPRWIGVANFVFLAAGLALLVFLLSRVLRRGA